MAKALAQYYQDKADATRDCDNALIGADATRESALVPAWGDVYLDTYGNDSASHFQAIVDAADAQLLADQKAAHAAVYGGYGDAEVTEATSVGAAEVTLATAEGDDEFNLATLEAGVADSLAGEETSAQEGLDGAIAGLNTTNAETNADDEASTTSDEGTEEEAAQVQLSDEEVSTATALAGAQADYAIVAGTLRVPSALALAQANPNDGEAQFDYQYAQGYVQWLTALKPAFVTNATAVAQAAAQDEEDTLAADVNLADEQAGENVSFVHAEAPRAEQESGILELEGDTYSNSVVTNTGDDQIGTAGADQTQMLDLANTAKTYLIACANADKDRAVNNANDVPDTEELYKKAIADAKLALADGQADADLAWITGKSLADEEFALADAPAWQTMSDQQAATSDGFELEDDADVQSESDTLAQDEADQMTAYALADQTQGNSDASAEASFQIAQASETAAVWSQIVGWALPTTAVPDCLPGLPWMQAQAGLATAEAAWATTSAANYQNYVAQLGTAEMDYANANAADFADEITTIDGLDKTDADEAANADEQLTTSLRGYPKTGIVV